MKKKLHMSCKSKPNRSSGWQDINELELDEQTDIYFFIKEDRFLFCNPIICKGLLMLAKIKNRWQLIFSHINVVKLNAY